MDWDEAGLLAGIDDDAARDARVRLLDALHADGATVDELRAAVREERLVLVPLERAMLAPARLTLAQLVEESGVERDLVEIRLRTLGVAIPDDPDTVAFGDDELAAVQRGGRYLELGMSVEDGRTAMRALSRSLANAVDPLRRVFAEALLEAGASEEEVALRFGEAIRAIMPLTSLDMDYLLRLHLRNAVRHDTLTAASRSSGQLPDAFEVAVAFADIVGFTALGEEVPEAALTDIAERLEDLAAEHVPAPARVVKTIGDAVMVVGRDPGVVVGAMLDLVAAADALDGMPPLRAGIAFGRAVPRLGDWFGPPVNLAARLAERARPESVLAANAVRDALGDETDGLRFSEAGFKRLKGISDPVPVLRVRRPGTAGTDP